MSTSWKIGAARWEQQPKETLSDNIRIAILLRNVPGSLPDQLRIVVCSTASSYNIFRFAVVEYIQWFRELDHYCIPFANADAPGGVAQMDVGTVWNGTGGKGKGGKYKAKDRSGKGSDFGKPKDKTGKDKGGNPRANFGVGQGSTGSLAFDG